MKLGRVVLGTGGIALAAQLALAAAAGEPVRAVSPDGQVMPEGD